MSAPMPFVPDPNRTTIPAHEIRYQTVQFHWGGLIGTPAEPRLVHLEQALSGTTLCGLALFNTHGPGWSRGGGYSDVRTPCPACAAVPRKNDPIVGLNAEVFGSGSTGRDPQRTAGPR
jgi:hypothetical protein